MTSSVGHTTHHTDYWVICILQYCGNYHLCSAPFRQ